MIEPGTPGSFEGFQHPMIEYILTPKVTKNAPAFQKKTALTIALELNYRRKTIWCKHAGHMSTVIPQELLLLSTCLLDSFTTSE